ncbi:ATP synthase subunit gamma, mitochondrial [Patella vulgata]|uniref:ATP synthase subunit gamma, mitochondrial n=1 Tax=Patella vulgata TaxID=6465 RepID=UPI0024A83AF8|nr:ATP synthase subunit gamma, mitochondrial [Patella vulgata]
MEAVFSRSVQIFTPTCTHVRGMATLKDIRIRLKSVTNIQKITKSMKMVSAAKYARAERELRPARPYGKGTQSFYDRAEVTQDDSKPNHLIVSMTSDRGLCGGIHSNVVKAIKAEIAEKKPGVNFKIVCIGDKTKLVLQRLFNQNMFYSFNNVGKTPPTFADASFIAKTIMESGYKYDFGTMYFNVFKSVVSYNTTAQPIFSEESVATAEKLTLYDSIDEDVLKSYNEFALASLVYYGLKEGACSEQSSRMTAMEGASKNAGEMIDKLQMTYNRTRQAVITRELIEIISGAAAL